MIDYYNWSINCYIFQLQYSLEKPLSLILFILVILRPRLVLLLQEDEYSIFIETVRLITKAIDNLKKIIIFEYLQLSVGSKTVLCVLRIIPRSSEDIVYL